MRLVASFLCRYHHGGFYQSIYEISWLQTLLFIQICLAHPMGSGSCSKNEAGYQTSSASFDETVPETFKLQAVYFEASGTIYAELRKEELDGKYERNSGSY